MRKLWNRVAVLLALWIGLVHPSFAEPVSVHFELGSQGHIFLPVTVDGESGLAILDNGAGVSVVDQTFAERRQKANQAFNKTLKGVLGGKALGKTMTIGVGDVEAKVAPALIDLAPMSKTMGRDIIAIIGASFFRDYVIEIDFVAQTVVFNEPDKFAPPAGWVPIPLKSSMSAKARIPLALEGNAPIEAVLDLGSNATLSVADGKTTRDWMTEGRPWTEFKRGVVRGGKTVLTQVKLTTARNITIAGATLSDIPAEVLTDTSPLDPSKAGLGVSVLSRFDLIFDIKGKRLWMRPNARVAEPFRRKLLGLTIASRPGVEGAMVAFVYPNSPAKVAGFEVGDVVVQFNGRPIQPDDLENAKDGQPIDFGMGDGSKRTVTPSRFY
jgi:hypothetical protein